MNSVPIQNGLRRLRKERGLSQQELAECAGVTRQTVSGIEAGHYLPSTAVALRLSRCLRCNVEDLFWIDTEDEETLSVRLAKPLGSAEEVDRSTRQKDAPGRKVGRRSPVGRRVATAQVGDRWVAHLIADKDPQASSWAADAIVAESKLDEPEVVRVQTERTAKRDSGAAGRTLSVHLLRSTKLLRNNLLFVGCDPALGVLASRLGDQHPASRLRWLHAPSLGALQAVARGEAHAAGTHLYSEEADEFNIPFIRATLPRTPTAVVNLAHMEEGFLVRPGNPLKIRQAADLGRLDVRLINREPGAGARNLLDRLLRQAGIDPQRVTGYERVAHGHLAVAQTVAMGAADVGVGSRSAAIVHGLDFIPLSEERFDLVIPLSTMADDRLGRVIDTLGSRPFRRELAALGGYETTQSGELIAEVRGA